jgi:hypothetical protein
MERMNLMVRRLDLRQWVPYYGIFKTQKDFNEGKPSLADENHPVRYIVGFVYHSITIAVPVIMGLEKLLR